MRPGAGGIASAEGLATFWSGTVTTTKGMAPLLSPAVIARATAGQADELIRRALAEGLADSHDVAMANKHLAFIACAYNRPAECEAAFRAAFAARP